MVATANKFSLRPAEPRDLEEMLRLLSDSKLPTAGVGQHWGSNYVVLSGADEILGGAGLEIYDASALLRAVVVAPSLRGRGAGSLLVQNRIAWARRLGLTGVYLLTVSATVFFERHGFSVIERALAPREIRESLEFRALCPDTALVMYRNTGTVLEDSHG